MQHFSDPVSDMRWIPSLVDANSTAVEAEIVPFTPVLVNVPNYNGLPPYYITATGFEGEGSRNDFPGWVANRSIGGGLTANYLLGSCGPQLVIVGKGPPGFDYWRSTCYSRDFPIMLRCSFASGYVRLTTATAPLSLIAWNPGDVGAITMEAAIFHAFGDGTHAMLLPVIPGGG